VTVVTLKKANEIYYEDQFKINQILKDKIDKKKTKKVSIKKKINWKMELKRRRRRNYWTLLLNQNQWINLETSQLNSLSSPSLKLTCVRVDFI